MITRKRMRELCESPAWANAQLLRGKLLLAGPVDWVEAVKAEGFPVDTLEKLVLTSEELWTFESLPIQPKIYIRKHRDGWLVKWKHLGFDTVIHFSPDVTYDQIADPIRTAYTKCVGAGHTMEDNQ